MTSTTIISLVISILSFLGLGSLCSLFWKDLHENKKKAKMLQSEEHQEAEKLKRQNEIREVMGEIIKPVLEDLAERKKLETITNQGLQAVLRDRLYQLNTYVTEKRCNGHIENAYATTDEKENFNNMYQKYHKLGANGVMDHKYEAFMSLPDYPPHEEK